MEIAVRSVEDSLPVNLCEIRNTAFRPFTECELWQFEHSRCETRGNTKPSTR